MTESPFRTPGNAFRYNNDPTTEMTKDFLLMDIICRDIMKLSGDIAFYIQVEHFNVDAFFGESRTKVLNRAFEVLLWNPDVAQDNVSHSFVKNGFNFVNEGELTYYCPMSYFASHDEDHTFTNTSDSSFIMDDTLFLYDLDLTDVLSIGDSITIAGATTNSNNATYIVSSIDYVEVELFTGDGADEERLTIWRSEIGLTPNMTAEPEEWDEEVDGEFIPEEIEIVDEEFPIDATVSFTETGVEIQPKMSDIIWIPKLEQLYQIEYVNDTPPHLMFNRNLCYSFRVQLYDYNSNIKIDSTVINKVPALADLQNLNELILDVTNDVISDEVSSGNVIDDTETLARDTSKKPSGKFKR